MMCLVLPIRFAKKATKTAQMESDMIMVNNLFEH